MRRWIAIWALIVTALFAGGAQAALPAVTQEDIEAFWTTYGGLDVNQYVSPLLVKWQNDAKSALQDSTPDVAAEKLATKYGFTRGEMREFLELWLVAVKLEKAGYGYLPKPPDKAVVRELHLRLARFAGVTGYKPLALQAVYQILTPYHGCEGDEFNAVLEQAADKLSLGNEVNWATQCPGWQRAFLKLAGKKNFSPLVSIVRYTGNVANEDYLALYSYLNSDAGLAHVNGKDREIVQTHLGYDYAMLLWELGLIDQGVKFVEKLPASVRERLLTGNVERRDVHADGLRFFVGDAVSDKFKTTLAGAYLVAGRTEDARRVFAQIDWVPRARAYLACGPGPLTPEAIGRGDPKCGEVDPDYANVLILDFLLNRTHDDPGALLAAFYPEKWNGPSGVVWVELGCRLLSAPQYRSRCFEARRSEAARLNRSNGPYDEDGYATRDALRNGGIEGFAEERGAFEKALKDVAARLDSSQDT